MMTKQSYGDKKAPTKKSDSKKTEKAMPSAMGKLMKGC